VAALDTGDALACLLAGATLAALGAGPDFPGFESFGSEDSSSRLGLAALLVCPPTGSLHSLPSSENCGLRVSVPRAHCALQSA